MSAEATRIAEQNKQLVRAFYSGPLVTGELSTVDDYFAAEFVDHDPPGRDTPSGPAGARAVIEFLNRGLSNRSIQIHQLFGEGDLVGMRFTLEGTHSGPYMGRAATGARVSLQVMVMLRVQGKIVERWGKVEATGFPPLEAGRPGV